MVAVLPAIVDVPRTRATPSTTSTSIVPSRNSPSPSPAAAVASVTNATRSAPGRPIVACNDCGMDVHAVSDQLDGDPGILQQCKRGPGLAVMQWPHRVEQVGADRRAELDGTTGLLVGRIRMPKGDNHSGVDQADDRVVAAEAFGCQGDHPDRAVSGGQQGVDLRRRRVAQLGVVVRPAVRRAQPRPLQMDTGDDALAGRFGECTHAGEQIGGAAP